MNDRRTDDLQIEDLASQVVDTHDAEQVKGGLNPQPLPPKLFMPIYHPPVFNPLPGLVRW
jgi:hypothetical protein